MEFYKEGKVIVNPLRIKDVFLYELEHNLILFNTETSRHSSVIIKEQSQNVTDKNVKAIEAMHQLKQQAIQMKEAFLLWRGASHRRDFTFWLGAEKTNGKWYNQSHAR